MLNGTSPFPDDQWSWASFPVFVNNFPGETSIQALGPFLNWIVCLLVIFKQGTPILVSKHTASSSWDAKQDVNSIVLRGYVLKSDCLGSLCNWLSLWAWQSYVSEPEIPIVRHHWLNGHEFEWTPGVGDGQGGLVCYSSWDCKESDMTEWLNWTERIQDDLIWDLTLIISAKTSL